MLGMVMNSKGLEVKDNNYLIVVLIDGNQFGFVYVDLSIGELKIVVLVDEEGVLNEVFVL